ncbi:putative L-tyrosine/L-aspartate decarboxylase [Clarias magur]|uniref:Putative L-tyrosine/L-aspartate decarboxylase n=1 Tax=Clarias magur TaxID=1594786 RepID=A0A8J4X8S9_CLAMG|nr:putative L-tyrosine/L-aspartate decarboxylase [Clarias magur]
MLMMERRRQNGRVFRARPRCSASPPLWRLIFYLLHHPYSVAESCVGFLLQIFISHPTPLHHPGRSVRP